MEKFNGPSSTIIRVIDHLDKQKEILKKELDSALVKEGKAYKCTRCKQIVKKDQIGDKAKKEELCSNCWHSVWKQRKADQLLHLESGIITNIELDNWYRTCIKRIDVYRDGKIHRLQVNSPEDGVATIDLLDVEPAREKPAIDDAMRPWQKERKEKPIFNPGGGWAKAIMKGGNKDGA